MPRGSLKKWTISKKCTSSRFLYETCVFQDFQSFDEVAVRKGGGVLFLDTIGSPGKSNWKSSPHRGEHIKYLKPPASISELCISIREYDNVAWSFTQQKEIPNHLTPIQQMPKSWTWWSVGLVYVQVNLLKVIWTVNAPLRRRFGWIINYCKQPKFTKGQKVNKRYSWRHDSISHKATNKVHWETAQNQLSKNVLVYKPRSPKKHPWFGGFQPANLSEK